jgi:hypothetical protein
MSPVAWLFPGHASGCGGPGSIGGPQPSVSVASLLTIHALARILMKSFPSAS